DPKPLVVFICEERGDCEPLFERLRGFTDHARGKGLLPESQSSATGPLGQPEKAQPTVGRERTTPQAATPDPTPPTAEPQGRHAERNAEIVRLKQENPGRTAGQIAALICKLHPEWATMENGKPLSARNVRAILSRANQTRDS